MANTTKIRGITIELNADTQGIADGLKEVRSSLSQTQRSLKDVEKLLKLDPSNTELLTEKQQYLAKAVQDTRKKLEEEQKLLQALQNGENKDKTVEQQNALQREIIETTHKLKDLEKQAKDAASVLGTQMQEAGDKIKAMGEKISSVGNKLTVGVTAPIVAAATAAAKFASDYDENLNKVEASFGGAAESVKKWATTATESFGMSESAALELAAQFGDMGTSMGLTSAEAAQMSTSLAGLAGDLASFKNISTDRAMNALTGIFTGQTKALQGLGVVMNEVNLTKFAEDQGKVYKNMTEAEKVMLRYQYVMSRTKNAQGDYARTSDGAANSLRTLKATLENLAVTLGKEVLPLITPLIQKLTEGIKKINEMDPKTKKLVVTLLGVAAAVGPIVSLGGKAVSLVGTITHGLGTLITKVAAHTGASVAEAAATEGAAIAQGHLNAAMNANVILGVVAAIVALVAVIAKLANHTNEAVKPTEELTKASQESAKAFQDQMDSMSSSSADIDELIDTMGRLQEKEELSTEEKEQMAFAYDRLAQLIPDLNFKIDKETGKLADNTGRLIQNTKALEDNFEAARARYEQEANAGKKSAAMAEYEAQADILDQLNKEKERLATQKGYLDSSGAANSPYLLQQYEDLTAAIEANEAAITSAQSAQDAAYETWMQYADAVDVASDSVEDSNDVIHESTNRIKYEAEVHNTFAQTVIQAYHNMRDAVVNAIQTQMSWLDAYEQAQTVSADEIEKNLTDQIAGVNEWQENLVRLADMGINKGLLKYLMDMGPKGAGYVRGLVEGGAVELEKINQLWADAMDVQGLATETGNELKGVLQDLTAGFEDLGYQAGAGFASGLTKAQQIAMGAARDMARNTANAAKNELAIASPSKVFRWIGEMTGLGFEQGMKDSFGAANSWLSSELASFSNPGLDNAAIYDAIRSGAGDASINVFLDDRELTRGLKGLGVSFA